MKILIGSDTYYPDVNGASYFARRLADGMRGRGHQVYVLCASRSLRTEVVRRTGVIEHRLPSVSVPYHSGFRFSPPTLLFRRVLREVKRIEPDVIHVQSHFFIGRALVRAAEKLDIPVVATNHFMPDNLVHYLRLAQRAEEAVADHLWRDFTKVFNQADLITAPTPFAARLIEEKGIDREVIPISCGIDLSRFNVRNDGDRFRDKYGVPEQPTCMYVGRLDTEKRVGDLIRALSIVREVVDVQLVIVGAGYQRPELIELAESEGVEGHVIFTGFVEDEVLPGAYAASDVFCIASVAELQSIVTMEAMATGKPVVAADAKALPHLVREGVNGHLFEPGDVGTLASRLAEILADEGKRARMGNKSLEIVAQHEVERVLTTFEEHYELARLMRQGGEDLSGTLHNTGTGADRMAAFDVGPVGGVHEVSGTPDALCR
jgi:glycosyltransferase involved in cell wall biosynthesis